MIGPPTPITDRARWNEALAALPCRHVLQTWEWGEFKSRWGWQPVRLLWAGARRPLAAAQVLRRAIPGTPWGMMYVPKGPALDYEDLATVRQVLTALAGFARARRAIFIKIDPDVARSYGATSENDNVLAQPVLDCLAAQGWRFSSQQIQFRNTIVIDLSVDEDALLARMKGKWRYNIRLAARKGVTVSQGGAEELPAFYRLYAQTSRRNGFLIRPEAYYLDLWSQFMAAGRASLILARVGPEPVAGLILFHFEDTAWYMYGASSDRYRNLMPNYLLQWEVMQLARRLGCRRYDMWGAPDAFDESDPMWGVYRFKAGFGGELIRGLGAFDFPTNRVAYWAYVVGLPRLLRLKRRAIGR
ncbi:MAG: lipid II:glycine glycyltransferase FemX [Anaerolineae bacterium]